MTEGTNTADALTGGSYNARTLMPLALWEGGESPHACCRGFNGIFDFITNAIHLQMGSADA